MSDRSLCLEELLVPRQGAWSARIKSMGNIVWGRLLSLPTPVISLFEHRCRNARTTLLLLDT
jgi:hypothetical protein